MWKLLLCVNSISLLGVCHETVAFFCPLKALYSRVLSCQFNSFVCLLHGQVPDEWLSYREVTDLGLELRILYINYIYIYIYIM